MMMGMQIHTPIKQLLLSKTFLPTPHKLFFSRNSTTRKCGKGREIKNLCGFPTAKGLKRGGLFVTSSSSNVAAPMWDGWTPEKSSKAPSLSDIVWPSAGAFAAMAILGKVDQMLAPKGISITIAPVGAVCTVLFATPSSPGARKYNVFVAEIGCAAIGVLAFSVFGPGWLARSTAVAAALAFMICTRAIHPSTSCKLAITFHRWN